MYTTHTHITCVVSLWFTVYLVVCYCVTIIGKNGSLVQVFTCVHGEVLLCTKSALSIVTTAVAAAVALKVKPTTLQVTPTQLMRPGVG